MGASAGGRWNRLAGRQRRSTFVQVCLLPSGDFGRTGSSNCPDVSAGLRASRGCTPTASGTRSPPGPSRMTRANSMSSTCSATARRRWSDATAPPTAVRRPPSATRVLPRRRDARRSGLSGPLRLRPRHPKQRVAGLESRLPLHETPSEQAAIANWRQTNTDIDPGHSPHQRQRAGIVLVALARGNAVGRGIRRTPECESQRRISQTPRGRRRSRSVRLARIAR